MVEADLAVDAVVDGGLTHVVQNPRPVGDRLRLGPRFERIAERIHVRVGADAGIAKQIPGAADAVAPLEDDVALARALLLQVIARADAGQAGADNEYVEVFCRHDDLRVAAVGMTNAGSPAQSYAGLTRVSIIFARWIAGSIPAMTRLGPSIPVMIALERAFLLDADVVGLVLAQFGQLDA